MLRGVKNSSLEFFTKSEIYPKGHSQLTFFWRETELCQHTNLARNFRARFINVRRGYTEFLAGGNVSNLARIPLSNTPCPAKATNHSGEGHGMHCGHRRNAAPNILRLRTIAVVLGACFALFVPRLCHFTPFDPSALEK